MSPFPWEELRSSLFLGPALAPGKTSAPLQQRWGQGQWPTSLQVTSSFTRRVLSRSGSFWSSRLTSSGREPSPYEQAGARVIRALVFLTCHRRTKLSTLQVGARWGKRTPWLSATFTWIRASATQVREGRSGK